MEEHERSLIDSAVSGDYRSFEELMTLYEKKMYVLSLKFCQDRNLANECMQDAMVRIYQKISTFRGESSFYTWVYQVVFSVCMDRLRQVSRERKKNVSLDQMLENRWEPAGKSTGPEEKVIETETLQELNAEIGRIMEKLQPEMAQALKLQIYRHMSYSQIAQIQNVSEGTVRSRISRGRKALREKLIEKREQFGF